MHIVCHMYSIMYSTLKWSKGRMREDVSLTKIKEVIFNPVYIYSTKYR